MAFTLPPLPYPFDALEPYIDARTMEIHHDKHQGAYVNNLNKALDGHPDLQAKSLDDLLKGLDAVPADEATMNAIVAEARLAFESHRRLFDELANSAPTC